MNNIRKIRTAQGLTTRELGEKMDVHFTTIARIERSTKPLELKWIRRFADALGVQPGEVADLNFGDIPPQRRIPVIGLVSAGAWREAIQEPVDEIVAPVEGENVFGLRIVGDSMNRVAGDGATVFVDPDRPNMHDGKFYVVMNGEGEATFKQYRADPARLEPASTNPAHKSVLLGQEAFAVVGRVVGVYYTM